MIAFRTMRRDDIKSGLALCRIAGWNQLSRDWEIFLKLSPGGCIVALEDDKVIGTVTTLRYQQFFSWIGMVLVDPAYRGQGAGMGLLKEALRVLENEETIKLDATPAGREIYLKLDFEDEYELSRMVATKPSKAFKSARVKLIEKENIKVISNFDKKIFGADRKQLLTWMRKGAPEYAFMIEDRDEVQGYCMARHGYHFTHIGPVVAKNMSVARMLISSVLSSVEDTPVVLDATRFDESWLAWLKYAGFTEQRRLSRMYRGKNNSSGVPENQFAILGPEFG
ncbi:MAG: GNAT family N-acetyltransferase [Ginsengibacter sp.]